MCFLNCLFGGCAVYSWWKLTRPWGRLEMGAEQICVGMDWWEGLAGVWGIVWGRGGRSGVHWALELVLLLEMLKML